MNIDRVRNFIRDNFKITSLTPDGGVIYILSDGNFLDLGPDGSHFGVDDELYQNGLIDYDPYEYGHELILTSIFNAIRCSDGAVTDTDAYIELPPKLPTTEQLDSLKDWIYGLSSGSIYVEGVKFDLYSVLPDHIIKRIKRYYSSGYLFEDVKQSVFNTEKTGIPYYDEILHSKEAQRYHNTKFEIVNMTPKEYIEKCAEIFESSFENQIRQVSNDTETINHLITVLKSGEKFPMTFLDYTNERSQEGRHRMYAAAKLYGWDVKYPVAIFTYIDEEEARRKKALQAQERIYRYINKAVMNSLQYSYNDVEEVKDQISYELEKYLDSYNLSIQERNNYLVINVDDVNYEISRDEFDFVEEEDD